MSEQSESRVVTAENMPGLRLGPYQNFCYDVGYRDFYSVYFTFKIDQQFEVVKDIWHGLIEIENAHLLSSVGPVEDDVLWQSFGRFRADDIIECHHFSSMNRVQREAQMIQLTEATAKAFRLDGQSSLFRILYVNFGDGEDIYLTVIGSHYVCDAYGALNMSRVFFDRLRRGAADVGRSKLNSVDVVTDYVNSLNAFCTVGSRKEVPYWNDIVARSRAVKMQSDLNEVREVFDVGNMQNLLLKQFHSPEHVSTREMNTLEDETGFIVRSFSPQATFALRDLVKSKTLSSEAILMKALQESVKPYLEVPLLWVDMLLNGRGFFGEEYLHFKTNYCCIEFGSWLLDFSQDADLPAVDMARILTEQIGQIPNRGMGLRGMLYGPNGEFRQNFTRRDLPSLELNFIAPLEELLNLPQDHPMLLDNDIYSGAMYDHTIFPFKIYYNIGVGSDGNWALTMRYNKRFYHADSARQIAERFVRAVHDIAVSLPV
ncbi:MAG: hypothetical protein WA790_21155 [Sulfitobacter sp.]